MRRSTLHFVVLWIVALFVVLPAAAEEGFPRTVTDGLGVTITLEQPPQRIFSAGLAMDNILLSLTDPERVVGVTRFALDPSVSYVVDQIRDHMVIIDQLNAEQVVAAHPDIVLVAFWSDPDAVKQMKDLGLPIYTLTHFDTVEDALDNIARIGRITGDDDEAARLIAYFYEVYDELQKKIEGRPRPRVLNYDSWGSTAGLGTSIHDIIQMAGGTDVAAEHGISGWKDIDAEAIITMNPDVMITASGDDFVKEILRDSALQTVPAVRDGRVYAIDHMDALNHHFILAIEQLARLLHPEAF